MYPSPIPPSPVNTPLDDDRYVLGVRDYGSFTVLVRKKSEKRKTDVFRKINFLLFKKLFDTYPIRALPDPIRQGIRVLKNMILSFSDVCIHIHSIRVRSELSPIKKKSIVSGRNFLSELGWLNAERCRIGRVLTGIRLQRMYYNEIFIFCVI